MPLKCASTPVLTFKVWITVARPQWGDPDLSLPGRQDRQLGPQHAGPDLGLDGSERRATHWYHGQVWSGRISIP